MSIASLSDPLWSGEDYARWSRHPDPAVRRWALERLTGCFGGVPDAVVAERVDDPDPIVSRLAIETAMAQDLFSEGRTPPPSRHLDLHGPFLRCLAIPLSSGSGGVVSCTPQAGLAGAQGVPGSSGAGRTTGAK